MTLYKVLDHEQRSYHGGRGRWTPRRWRSVSGPLRPCKHGIHACREDQLVTWLGPEIWTFEFAPGVEVIDAGDKVVGRKGRILARVEAWDERAARLFAADCAEHVVHLAGDDPRPRAAIEVARRHARGEASDKEMQRAWAAARSATWAAWVAAGAAARAATWPATAGAAAQAAARAALFAVAWEAEWVAAGASEREWQTARLMEYLRGGA